MAVSDASGDSAVIEYLRGNVNDKLQPAPAIRFLAPK